MMRDRLGLGTLARVTWCVVALIASAERALAQGPSFRLTLDAATFTAPYTGRLYVVLIEGDNREVEPREEAGNWFDPPYMFAIDVDGLAPGAQATIGADALSHPEPLGALPPGTYTAQAFARLNPDSPDPGRGEGDPISEPVKVEITQEGLDVALTLDRRVPAEAFEETDRVKMFEMVSPLLSAFHGREVVMRAGVRLPKDWKQDEGTSYPTVYWITGFGGDHGEIHDMERAFSRVKGADECLIIVPDASCYWGHSVFVDSATNGPRGRALVEELIPAIEEAYRGAGGAEGRAVTGGSSGGWAALWLQVTYPDAFGSCWSHCPDPVDFRDFQRINLYEPGANMYVDETGAARPLARDGDRVVLLYRDFVAMESLTGPGGQIGSFEATFSARGEDGRPRALFDRVTGAVDTEVARSWEAFDIRLVMERNWETLGPKVAGKIHVYAGEMDTFYLEGATVLLAESLKGLGSDAEVKIVKGMPHTIYPPGLVAMFESLTAGGVETEAGEPATVESTN